MLQSHVIEVSGTFVGVAITTAAGFRFRAVHMKVDELDESLWRSLDELNRAVEHLFTTGRLGAVCGPVANHSLQNAASSVLRASATGNSSWME